jgi:hypothetical protein
MIPRKPLRPVFATLNQDKNINKAPSTTETEMIFRAIVSVSKKNLSLMVDQKNRSIIDEFTIKTQYKQALFNKNFK